MFVYAHSKLLRLPLHKQATYQQLFLLLVGLVYLYI